MIPSFRYVALWWGLIVVVLSLLVKNRGLAVLLILTYGAFGILPENEINLFTQAMFFLTSLALVLFTTEAQPLKTEAIEVIEHTSQLEEAEEVPNFYTRQEAEQFAALIKKSKEVHKTG